MTLRQGVIEHGHIGRADVGIAGRARGNSGANGWTHEVSKKRRLVGGVNQLAVREGFEPSVRVSTDSRLAGGPVQPLQHLTEWEHVLYVQGRWL